MRDRATKSASLGRYKEQAARLREFLAGAGVEFKHTHALEAVARMHGFRNYHLLEHAVEAEEQTWLVSTITGGLLPITRTAHSLSDGVATFCHQLARVAVEDEVELTVRAQESGPHIGLYALNYGAMVVALTRPATMRLAPREDLSTFEDWSLGEMAKTLSDAVYERLGWDRLREQTHDEDFLRQVSRGIDLDVLRGATDRDALSDTDERVVLASRYLMRVALAEGAQT